MIEQKGQLFFDPEITGLSKKAIGEMTKEKNEMLYPIALNHFHSLIPSIRNMIEGDMQWLKMEFTVPYFMDLCFRAKNNVYGVIFGQEINDGNIYFPLDLDVSIKKCEENDIIPCVLVFDNNLDGSLIDEVPEDGKEAVQDELDETGGVVSSIKKEYDENGNLISTTVTITYTGEDGANHRTEVVIDHTQGGANQ